MQRSLFLILVLLCASACAAPAQNAQPFANATIPRAATSSNAPSNNPSPQPEATQAVPASAQAISAPTEIPTVLPVSTATPAPAQLLQLMDGTCCASPGWYSDSETILFIDKPTTDAPVGFYQININKPLISTLWNEQIAFYTREFDYAQIPERAGTRLIRIRDGKEIRVPNGGRQVSFSPDRTRVIWTETRETFPIENRVSNIMLAPIDFDGAGVGQPQRITQILRGGVSGWVDNQRVLMNGRKSRETFESTTSVYDLTTGKETEIFTAERSRLTSLSRDGSWIAYVITNEADESRNGLWVERTDGTDQKKVELFGAAQWRDGTHLIIAPFEMDAPSHSFWDYDVETGETRRLTPESEPFQITAGDWSVSPDGKKIVFVSAADNNIWLWKLPE